MFGKQRQNGAQGNPASFASSPIRFSCPFETGEKVWGEDKSICNITRVLPPARGMEETRENVTLCIRNRVSKTAPETELRASCVPGKLSATEPQLRHMNMIHRRAARGGPYDHVSQEMEGQGQWTGQLHLPGVYYAPTTRWGLE